MNKVFNGILQGGRYVISFITAFAMIIPLLIQGPIQLRRDIKDQVRRINELEVAYSSGKVDKVDESDFFDGDLQAMLDSGIHYDKMSFLATHNSYERHSVWAFDVLTNAASDFVPDLLPAGSGTLNQQTLTEQLNVGIRSFELDVEAANEGDRTTFRCMHNPLLTMTTSCYNFELALKEIKMWSDYNPNHLPITIMIEPKKKFIPMPVLKYFDAEYTKALDEILRENLGDTLFTPADMLRDYDSFAAMRKADDWCEVNDLLGKVMVLLHFDGEITPQYIALDPTVHAQAMFPTGVTGTMNDSSAGFIIINDAATALAQKDLVQKNHLIVRTRVDTHPAYSTERREEAFASEAQIQSTDFPIRSDLKDGDYYVAFPGDKTVRVVGQ